MYQLEFESGGTTHTASIHSLVIAGWTGRDLAAVERHIEELAAIGVARPRTVPSFYPLGANLLTTSPAIDVVGSASSGEVEVVLISLPYGMFVGVGSDHTDRKLETVSVTVAKQMCPKPLSRTLWPFDAVGAHWDTLMLRSWVTRGGTRRLYQEGPAARMLNPRDLVSRYLGAPGVLPAGTVMYCGTLAVNGEIGGGERFEIELEDPVLKRKLQHAYSVHHLALADA